MRQAIQISDEAYRGLMTHAWRQKYATHPPTVAGTYSPTQATNPFAHRQSSRGLSAYVAALAAIPPALYEDLRPHAVSDLYRLNNTRLTQQGRVPDPLLPIWHEELYARRTHLLAIPQVTIDGLMAISAHWGITNYRREDSVSSVSSRISVVLEAVGLGWLSPMQQPYAPTASGQQLRWREASRKHYNTGRRATEIDWM